MTDILIIGAGSAGLSAAIAAHDAGASVRILAKAPTQETASYQTQGGIAAALNNAEDGDNWQIHAEDTLASGKGLADHEPVEILCREAIDRVRELDDWGAAFDRLADGRIAQRPYGGHRKDRACHAGDQTGIPLMQTLREQVEDRRIEYNNQYLVVDLWVENGASRGVIAWQEAQQQMVQLPAKAVIIATGGLGQTFAVTSNPAPATGDGLHWVRALDVALRDMEFVQFHPTGLYPSGTLISEACRAEGGYLINGEGRRFMFDYDERGELATRDIVARAIQSEITAGRGIDGQPYVGLDLRHLGADKIQAKLPAARDTAWAQAGVNVLKEMIPVAPTQHYAMGGIPLSVDGEVLNQAGKPVPGVFAAGEVGCLSVHGANRLGCNSFVECLVFGQRAGRQAAMYTRGPFDRAEASVLPEMNSTLELPTAAELAERRDSLRLRMSWDAGVVRWGERLQSLCDDLQAELGAWLDRFPDRAQFRGPNVRAMLEYESLLRTGLAIAQGALRREQSVGAHYRES